MTAADRAWDRWEALPAERRTDRLLRDYMTEEFRRGDASDFDAVRQRLRAACDRIGSQSQWAEAHGIPKSRVSEVLAGTRAPNGEILEALGLRWAIVEQEGKSDEQPCTHPRHTYWPGAEAFKCLDCGEVFA